MTGYVLKRTSDGAYVSRPGSDSSYAKRLEHAQVFPTRDAALKNSCVESEHIVSLDEIFRGNSA